MRQTGADYNPFPDIRSPDVRMTFQVLSTNLTKSKIRVVGSVMPRLGGDRMTVNGAADLAAKYATTEQFGWPLDGSCEILPKSGAETGYWPNRLSGENLLFDTPITVTYTLPKAVHTLGWTFHFDSPANVYCPEVRAVTYLRDSHGLYQQVDDHTAVLTSDGIPAHGWSMARSVNRYDKVEFTFYALNEPFRYMRLVEVDFGLSRSYDNHNIGDVHIQHELALDGDALPAKKLTFTFDNADREFNVLDPVDVYQYWRNGQSVEANVKIGDELVYMGSYSIARAEIGDNYLTAKVTAYDEANQLGSQSFYPASLAESETVTLQAAVEKVLEGYGLTVNYNGLENEPVSLRIKDTHTKRAVLHYLAQAVCASAWIDRDDVVQIKRLAVKETPDAELTADALYDWSGVSVAEEVTGVTLTVDRELDEGAPTESFTAGAFRIASDYLESGVWNYTKKSANGNRLRSKALLPVKAGMVVTYSNPTLEVYFGVGVTPDSSSSSGFVTSSWISPGAVGATYTIPKDGYLTINVAKAGRATAISVSDYDCDIVLSVPGYTATGAEDEAARSYSNPCVAPGYGWPVANWLLAVSNLAKIYAVKNRCDPAVEIGDTYKIADVFGNDDSAIVTGLDVSYNGTLSAVTEARGEFPDA